MNNTGQRPKNDKSAKPATEPTHGPVATEELPLDLQLLEFWDKNKKAVLGIAGALAVLAAIGWGVYSWWESRQAEMGLALAQAKDAKDFASVADRYRGEEVGAYALLLLADQQYQDGKYADAEKTYQRFIDEYPKSPFLGSAFYGKGAARESQGDYQGAINVYNMVVNQTAGDIHALDARLGIARCEEARKNWLKARQTYEEVIAAAANWAGTEMARACVEKARVRITVIERDARARGEPLQSSLTQPPPSVPGGMMILPPTPSTPASSTPPAPAPATPPKPSAPAPGK
ncbi:MAG: tetratricopeptide repeat protein [Verrucomicrobia bacterium]|nr:tetratricopeptide repeat protein [Verrucomicrobiota bacterium]